MARHGTRYVWCFGGIANPPNNEAWIEEIINSESKDFNGSRWCTTRGGEPKGSKTKRTIALDEVAALQAAGGYKSPVKFLLDVMNDATRDIEVRVHSAIAAACYTNKKKPADVHVAGNVSVEIEPVVLRQPIKPQ